jgi:hypothetical protein
LGATLAGGRYICGKLLRSPYLAVDKQKSSPFVDYWLFFVQFVQGHVLQGLQGLANNLSTEAPTDFVGNRAGL